MIVFANRVLCLTVLFLLQSAGWMGMVQGEPLISVMIKDYSFYQILKPTSDLPSYDSSKEHCKTKSGHVVSAYTKAIRTVVMKKSYQNGHREGDMFYVGADMEYSVHKEPDPAKRCVYTVPSLNCIYKWNQGLWANALGDESGVGFYQGNDQTVKGAGVINGYDVAVYFPTALKKRPFIVRQKYKDDDFVFHLVHDKEIPVIQGGYAAIICEIQSGTIKRAEAPTNITNKSQDSGSGVSGTSEKSGGFSGLWKRWGVVVVIALCFLATLIIMLCIYRCVRKCRRKADVRRVTEESRAPTRTDREGSVMREGTENPNMNTDSHQAMNPLVREDRSAMRRNTWMEAPQQANAMARADDAAPNDFDAAAEQQSRRLGNMRRAQPIRRTYEYA